MTPASRINSNCKVPKGTSENSPRFQPWALGPRTKKAPPGAKECGAPEAQLRSARLVRPSFRSAKQIQSQGDCGLQPKVAPPSRRSGAMARREGGRNKLPWVTGTNVIQPQRGCGATGENRRNPVGVEPITDIAPRVARAAQPWALGRNPFGIRSRVDGHLKKMGAVWN